MSTYFHIDSRWRDRNDDENANPASFTVPVEVARKWKTENRTVQAVRPHDKKQVTNMVHTIKLLNLTLPYDIGSPIGTTLNNLTPYVFVEFRSTSKLSDRGLLNTTEDGKIVNKTPDLVGDASRPTSLKDAIFVAYCDKVQGVAPAWIQYKSSMNQTFRIDTKDSIRFRVFTADGKTVPIVDNVSPALINPARQVNALFEVTPCVRADEYDNHLVTLYNRDA